MRKKVGLMGGSFDPVHMGHIGMAKAALKQLPIEEVWFIPTKSTPLKNHRLTDEKYRWGMLKKAAASDSRFKVSPVELKRSGTSYTIDTLTQLKKDFPEIDFYWLLGADQTAQFDQWKDADKLMELARFAAVSRDGKAPETGRYDFEVIEMEPVPVSSTEIRKGHKLNYLPDGVLDYILDNELYVREWVADKVSPHRYYHSCSVAKLSRDLAKAHGLDEHRAWLMGMFHDIAKDLPKAQLRKWVEAVNPEGLNDHHAIWHGYAGAEIADRIYGLKDDAAKNAIFNHVKGTSYDVYAMILFIADKLDPLRGYDSSGMIKACMHDLYNGFMLVHMENKKYLEKGKNK
ncbi:MAG: nicotinate (nicotinamide) nucleotide adenylyltransferase [Erysipelotrichaceae bacterium]|nr:nicotinate (nicotinamide) nucleotide adenylyltransferase [Erysipelotrichaceae bacterium]